MGKNKRRVVSASGTDKLEHLDKLQWSSSFPDDDPFSLLSGPGAALDGGLPLFFSLS